MENVYFYFYCSNKIVNFRCWWEEVFKEKTGAPIKQKLVYYTRLTSWSVLYATYRLSRRSVLMKRHLNLKLKLVHSSSGAAFYDLSYSITQEKNWSSFEHRGTTKLKSQKNCLTIYIKFQNLLFRSTSLFSGKSPPNNSKNTSFSLSSNPIWGLHNTRTCYSVINRSMSWQSLN